MKRAGTWIFGVALGLLILIVFCARWAGRWEELLPLRPVASEAYRVDLNTCSREELEMLPGIGETIAGRILAYREAEGGFSQAEELLQIPGIGEKTFEGIRQYVTAQ